MEKFLSEWILHVSNSSLFPNKSTPIYMDISIHNYPSSSSSYPSIHLIHIFSHRHHALKAAKSNALTLRSMKKSVWKEKVLEHVLLKKGVRLPCKFQPGQLFFLYLYLYLYSSIIFSPFTIIRSKKLL